MKRKDIYIGTQRILYQIINEKLSYVIFRGKYFVNNWFSYIFSIEKSLCMNSLSYSLLFFWRSCMYKFRLPRNACRVKDFSSIIFFVFKIGAYFLTNLYLNSQILVHFLGRGWMSFAVFLFVYIYVKISLSFIGNCLINGHHHLKTFIPHELKVDT